MNDLTLSILRILSTWRFHSGESLAHQFGVTRGTIHNALKGLEPLGVSVSRARGHGYRLIDDLSWLETRRIAEAAGSARARLKIHVVPVLDSTNTTLLEQARLGAPRGTVLAAELQTRGRGRRARIWQSSLGSGLTFSLLWTFDRGISALSGLTLAVGVGIVRALRDLGVADAMLKWPNDILRTPGKLGGILTEVEGDALGPSAAVIGVGLNVKLRASLRARIDQDAADLADQEEIDRSVLLGRILAALVAVLEDFERHGFPPLREEWERYHALQGRKVRLQLPDGSNVTGEVLGVADDGALLLDTPGGIERYHGGEIGARLRPVAA